jgi:hypothetical protein
LLFKLNFLLFIISPATNPWASPVVSLTSAFRILLSSLEMPSKIVYEFDQPGPMIPQKHTGKFCSERAGKGM